MDGKETMPRTPVLILWPPNWSVPRKSTAGGGDALTQGASAGRGAATRPTGPVGGAPEAGLLGLDQEDRVENPEGHALVLARHNGKHHVVVILQVSID